jgi:chaperonin GroEL
MSVGRKVQFETETRDSLQNGVDILANAVKKTLGPKGKNVAIDRGQTAVPHVTKDGVTVAQSIYLDDPLSNMGASLLREASSKTADNAGDGTTTSTILAQKIFNDAIPLIDKGANHVDLKRGIDIAISKVVEEVKKMSKEVKGDDIKNIATISANNDDFLGGLIADTIKDIGVEGVISVEQSNTRETFVKKVDGLEIGAGYISPMFINKEDYTCTLINPSILVCDFEISHFQQLLPVIANISKSGKPLLIIAEDVNGDALTSIAHNVQQGRMSAGIIKVPTFGDLAKEYMKDLATSVGATYITEDQGMTLDNFTPEMFGEASKVISTDNKTTIIGGDGDAEEIAERIQLLTIAQEEEEDTNKLEVLRERKAKLFGGIAMMRIGADTDAEMKEKTDRVDDALRATRCAIEEGVVTGGGLTLVRCSDKLFELKTENDDQAAGITLVQEALYEPLKTIVSNAGLDSKEVIHEILTYESRCY